MSRHGGCCPSQSWWSCSRRCGGRRSAAEQQARRIDLVTGGPLVWSAGATTACSPPRRFSAASTLCPAELVQGVERGRKETGPTHGAREVGQAVAHPSARRVEHASEDAVVTAAFGAEADELGPV